MGSHKSIIREAIERLDSLMAIGQSRFQAKQIHSQSLPAACAGFHQLGTNHSRCHALSLAG